MTIKHKNTHYSTTTHPSTPENKLDIPSKKLQPKKNPKNQEAHRQYCSSELSYIYGLGVRISTVFEIFGHFLY
jgi:hypothetical protein